MTTKSLAAKPAGLDLAGLGDLASMLDAPAVHGQPQLFDLEDIREDENVRSEDNPGFGQVSMEELAQSIKDRGIKSPLSLRPDSSKPGSYIINHGHRRFRAAKRAGLSQVPGFIDRDFTSFDQVSENLDREDLTARELADFIGARMAEGMAQAEIAAKLHRSKAFVSQHVALLNLPDPVAEAFASGKVKDVTVANELARAHRENPQIVKKVLEQNGESLAAKPITRDVVKAIRETSKRTPSKSDESQKSGHVHRTRSMEVEEALSEHLGTPVQIRPSRKGDHVQLCIDAANWDHFNELMDRLGLGQVVDPYFPKRWR